MQCNIDALAEFLKNFVAVQLDDKIEKEPIFKLVPIIKKRQINKIISELNNKVPIRKALVPLVSIFPFDKEILFRITKEYRNVRFTIQITFVFCLQLLSAIFCPEFVIDNDIFNMFLIQFERFHPSFNPAFFVSELTSNAVETPEFEWTNDCLTNYSLYVIGMRELGDFPGFPSSFGALITKIYCIQRYDLCLTLISAIYKIYAEDFPLASNVDHQIIIEFISFMLKDLNSLAISVLHLLMERFNFHIIPVILTELADIFTNKISACEVSIRVDKYPTNLKADINEINFDRGIPPPPKLLYEEYPIDFLRQELIDYYNLILPIFQLDNKFGDTLFLSFLSDIKELGDDCPHLIDFMELCIKLLEIRPDYKLLMAFYNAIADKVLFSPDRTVFSAISLVVLSYRRKFLDLIAGCESKIFPGILIFKQDSHLLFSEIVGYITSHRETINMKLFENEQVITATAMVAKKVVNNLYAFSVLLDFTCSLISKTNSIFFKQIIQLIDVFMHNYNFHRYILSFIFHKLSKINTNRSIKHILMYLVQIYQSGAHQDVILKYISDLIHCNPTLCHPITVLIKHITDFSVENTDYILKILQLIDKKELDAKILLKVGNSIKKIPNFENDQQIYARLLSIIAANIHLNLETKFIIERPYFIMLLFIVYGDTKKLPDIFKLFEQLTQYSFENIWRLQIGNVDYIILNCLRNNFTKTEVPLEGITFPVHMTRKLYDDMAKDLYEKISFIQSNSMAISELSRIFAKPKNNLEVTKEAADLLINTLSKSHIFNIDYFLVEFNDYIKIVDDYDIDFNKENYFDIYISINDYIVAQTGCLLNILTIKDEYNNAFRIFLHNSKIYARSTTNSVSVSVILYTTYQWQGEKYLGIKYIPKEGNNAQFITWFDDREFGEASFMIPVFKGRKKLCFGGGAGQQRYFHLIQGLCGKIQINDDTFNFESKLFNLATCAARFDLHNAITVYFEDFGSTPLELDLLMLGIIHKIFVSTPESQKTFSCVFKLYQNFATTPKKMCFQLFKVLLAVYQDITHLKLKKNWFRRLVFNFTLWAKCDAASFCYIVNQMISLMQEDQLYKEMRYYDFSFFAECLLYFRLLFSRTKRDKVHPHEVKLNRVNDDAGRAKCNEVMMCFIKKLGMYAMSFPDIDILHSLLIEAENPNLFLEIIRDLAPVILNLDHDFAQKMALYRPPDEKTTIILYCQAMHKLNHPKIHVLYMQLAQKYMNSPFVNDLLADMIENVQSYPNTFTFILSMNKLQTQVLPVIFSLLNNAQIIQQISFDGTWYLPIVQQCLTSHQFLQLDSFVVILELINNNKWPDVNFMILFNIVFLFQEKSLCSDQLLLTFLKAAKKVKNKKFIEELFVCCSFGLLFSMNYNIIRKELSKIMEHHLDISRDSSEISNLDNMISLFNNFSSTKLYNAFDYNLEIKDLCLYYFNEIKNPTQFEREVREMIMKIFDHSLVHNVQQFEDITRVHDLLKQRFMDSIEVTKNHLSQEIFIEQNNNMEVIFAARNQASHYLESFIGHVERSYSKAVEFKPRFIKDRHLYNGAPMIFKFKRPKKPDSFKIIAVPFDLKVNKCRRISLTSNKEASIRIDNNKLIYTTKSKEIAFSFDIIKYVRKVAKDMEIRFVDGNTFLLQFDSANGAELQKPFFYVFNKPYFEFNSNETSFNVILDLNEKCLGRSFNAQSSYPIFPRFLWSIEDFSLLRDFTNDLDFSDPPPVTRAVGKKIHRLEDEFEKNFLLADFFFNFDAIFPDDHIPKGCRDKYDFLYNLRRTIETEEFREKLIKWMRNMKIDFKIRNVKYDNYNFDQSFSIPIQDPDFIAAIAAPENKFHVFIQKGAIMKQYILAPYNRELKFRRDYDVTDRTFTRSNDCMIAITNVGQPIVYFPNKVDAKDINRCMRYKTSSHGQQFSYIETGYEVVIVGIDRFFKVNEKIIDYCISDTFKLMAVVTNGHLYLFNVRRKRLIYDININYTPVKVEISDGFCYIAVSTKKNSYFYTQTGIEIRKYDYPFDRLITISGFDFFATKSDIDFLLTHIVSGFAKKILVSRYIDFCFNSDTRAALFFTKDKINLFDCSDLIPLSKFV